MQTANTDIVELNITHVSLNNSFMQILNLHFFNRQWQFFIDLKVAKKAFIHTN